MSEWSSVEGPTFTNLYKDFPVIHLKSSKHCSGLNLNWRQKTCRISLPITTVTAESSHSCRMWCDWSDAGRSHLKWGSLHLERPPKDTLVLQSEEAARFPLVPPRDKNDLKISPISEWRRNLWGFFVFSIEMFWWWMKQTYVAGVQQNAPFLGLTKKDSSAIWKLHSIRCNCDSDWITQISFFFFPNEELDEIKPPCNVISLEQQPYCSLLIPCPPPSSTPFLQHFHPQTPFHMVPWSWVTGHRPLVTVDQ